MLCGDYNVVPTDFDIYDPKGWRKDALLQPESRDAYQRLLAQGWIDALRKCHPEERIYTFWDFFRNHWQRNAGLRIDHLLLNATLAPRLVELQCALVGARAGEGERSRARLRGDQLAKEAADRHPATSAMDGATIQR